MNQTSALNPAAVLELARQVLRIEADAVAALSERLDDGFLDAVSLILNCSGRVIVSGIGKSGHVAARSPPPWPAPARRPTSCTRRKPATATWA